MTDILLRIVQFLILAPAALFVLYAIWLMIQDSRNYDPKAVDAAIEKAGE